MWKNYLLEGLSGLGGMGALKLVYDGVVKFFDNKKEKRKTATEAETSRYKVDTEAEAAREKRVDDSTMALIDRLESAISKQEIRLQGQIDGLHIRLDEEAEKTRLAEVFKEAAERRAETAETAHRRLTAEHELLALELSIAKRENYDVTAISAMRETTIRTLEARLAECEAKIQTLEKFCLENNLVLPVFASAFKGDRACA